MAIEKQPETFVRKYVVVDFLWIAVDIRIARAPKTLAGRGSHAPESNFKLPLEINRVETIS